MRNLNNPSVARAGTPLCLSQHTFADSTTLGCVLDRGHGGQHRGLDDVLWSADHGSAASLEHGTTYVFNNIPIMPGERETAVVADRWKVRALAAENTLAANRIYAEVVARPCSHCAKTQAAHGTDRDACPAFRPSGNPCARCGHVLASHTLEICTVGAALGHRCVCAGFRSVGNIDGPPEIDASDRHSPPLRVNDSAMGAALDDLGAYAGINASERLPKWTDAPTTHTHPLPRMSVESPREYICREDGQPGYYRKRRELNMEED